MEKNITTIIVFLLLCCTGCRTSADFNYIENSIRDQIYPAKLDKDFKFSMGSHSMKMLSGFVDDEEEANAYLKEIKEVQVGIYKIRNTEKRSAFRIPLKVEKCLVEKGWEPFVRVHKKHGDNVLLLYRQLSENEAGMYAITMERDELVILEINGNLGSILEKAICKHRLAGMTHL